MANSFRIERLTTSKATVYFTGYANGTVNVWSDNVDDACLFDNLDDAQGCVDELPNGYDFTSSVETVYTARNYGLKGGE